VNPQTVVSLAVVSLLALLVGCVSLLPAGAPVHYHALAPLPANAVAVCSVRIGVRPVAIPGYVDRAEVLIERRGTELVFSGTDVWAAPLRTEITRTLGEAVAARWSGARFVPHPWRFGEEPRWALDVAFETLDPASGMLTSRARWALLELPASKEIASGRSDERFPMPGADAAASANAISQAVAVLADQVATVGRAALAPHEPSCR